MDFAVPMGNEVRHVFSVPLPCTAAEGAYADVRGIYALTRSVWVRRVVASSYLLVTEGLYKGPTVRGVRCVDPLSPQIPIVTCISISPYKRRVRTLRS